MSQTLDFETFAHAVETTVGLSFQVDLQPAGGFDHKVYPPTFLGGRNGQQPIYGLEHRTVDGTPVHAVLLDSVPSQANRLEEALTQIADPITLPVLSLTINNTEVTTLNAPHRAVDAYFLDSYVYEDNQQLQFLKSNFGQAMVNATPQRATALYHYAPTTLLFGMWASAKGVGHRDARFARTLASEIIGWGPDSKEFKPGIKTQSRIDLFNVSKGVTLYSREPESTGQRWDITPLDSKSETKKSKTKKPETKKPSELNIGNIAPTLNPMGGFTVQGIRQYATLSFLGLRHWHFPLINETTSNPLRDTAGHTVLAILGLLALFQQFNGGYGLRSGCDLQPLREPTITLLGRTANDDQPVTIPASSLTNWLQQALTQAQAHGLSWATPETMPKFTPTPQQITILTSANTLEETDPSETAEE